MKKTLKRLICILLSLSVLLTVPISVFADETEADGLNEDYFSGVRDVPVVYIGGWEEIIYSDKNDIESEAYFTSGIPDSAVAKIIRDIAPTLTSAMLSNKWEPFCDALYEGLLPYLSPIALDENGNSTGNEGYDCLKEETISDKAVNGRYGLYDYKFVYDWRLDPVANAAELDLYIGSVKAATGAQKVDIIASGIGYSTLLAYLYTFGCASVNEILLYGAGLEGIDLSGVLFSGNIEIDDILLNRYIQQTPSSKDPFLSLAKFGADFLIGNGFADSVFDITAKIYSLVYTDIIPRILIDSYATMPGCWSTVGEEYFEQAKAFIFPEKEDVQTDAIAEEAEPGEDTLTEEVPEKDYTVLIEKIDFFHNNILVNGKELLDSARESGVNVYNVVKYGFCSLPISPNSHINSDGYISLADSTCGATVVPYGEKLSEEYLTQASKDGAIMFISPDNEIDASTGYLPTRTWFIKNLNHQTNPDAVDLMIEKILDREGYTSVFSMEDYPQYMVCNNDASRMEKLNETGVITPTAEEEFEDFISFDSPTNMLKKIIQLIGNIVLFFKKIINRIIPQ